MYRRILVALDGSENSFRALDHAVSIAEKFGSELILLAVVPKLRIPLYGGHARAALDLAEYQERMWSFYRSVLNEAEYKVLSEHPGLEMIKLVREGRPSDVIVEEEEKDSSDLVVRARAKRLRLV